MRLNVFQSAYFKYRDIATKQLGPGHYQDLKGQRTHEEASLAQFHEDFEDLYEVFEKQYSRVSLALYVKSKRKLLSHIGARNEVH